MLKRKDGESYLAFVDRATQALSSKQIGYEDWSKAVLGEIPYGSENLRRCSLFLNKFLEVLDNEEIKELNDDERIKELERAKEELIKERKKLQTVNLEAQEYYRLSSRRDLLNEQIVEAIKNLPPIECKRIDYSFPIKTTGLLVLADQHFDSNFEVKGLFDEVVNKYDKETFKTRMWYLLGQMENDRFEYDKLMVVSCGDALEGLLRMTSLQKLRMPVVEAAMQFADFMATWLIEAHNRLQVPIVFNLISGNHDIIRNLTQKPEFPEESFAKVIHEFIKLKINLAVLDPKCNLQDGDIVVEPYADVYYTTLYGSNIMFAHGETSNLVELMNYYENLYRIEIDTLYAGHLHRGETKPAGVANVGDREVIRVPSIAGTDPFAKSIKKHSRAGAYFALYSDNGKELNKTYYLN